MASFLIMCHRCYKRESYYIYIAAEINTEDVLSGIFLIKFDSEGQIGPKIHFAGHQFKVTSNEINIF